MKRLGLVGGTTWVSTLEYYSRINSIINERTGGREFANLVIHSVNFGDVIRNNDAGDQAANGRIIFEALQTLKAAGCEAAALGANTPHMYISMFPEQPLPIIHIADSAARHCQQQGWKKVGLLGTKFTMEGAFLRQRYEGFGIEILTPNEEDRDFIHQRIYSEMTYNIFTEETRSRHLGIIKDLVRAGAEAVSLACTEIPILLKGVEGPAPLIDTLALHCEDLADFCLS